jgi:tetratricopeptide (TPR) repeat protein
MKLTKPMSDKEKKQQAEEYLEQGNAYAFQDDYAKAIELYNKAIELKPDFEFAYNNLGNAYSKRGDYAKAIELYSKAIELNLKDPVVYNNMGNTYYEQGDYAKAIESYSKAIELNPDDASAYNNLGNVYEKKGNYSKAIESFHKAIELEPDEAKVHYNLGNLYCDQGDYSKAIESYSKAIELNPDDTEVYYYNLGSAYFERDDYFKAIESYSKAIELNPDDANTYYNIGIVYEKKGDYSKAIESYSKVIELNPDYEDAYNNLGNAYYYQGDYSKAIELYSKAIELNPDFALAYSNLGIAYTAQSNYAGAIESFHKAIELELENDAYFSNMLEKYGVNEDNENDDFYKEIYISSKIIMRLLHVGSNEERARGFAHYTRKDTAEKLLIEGKKDAKKENASRFRLSSILTSNDPTEGEIAFKYLGLENKEADRDYQAFIACFTFDPECLNQFRLYGKEQGKEATGVSLVFGKEFFAEVSVSIASSSIADKDSERPTKWEAKEKYALYRCIYIDPETEQIVTLGHKDDYTFFRDKMGETKQKLSNEDIGKVSEQIGEYKKQIHENLQAVRKEFDALKQLIQQRDRDKISENLLCALLMDLRYLVKHVAFKEEQECRVVKVESLTSEDTKVKLEGDSMFVETKAIDKFVQRIYFAPSVSDMELFHEKLVFTGSCDIECRQCTHPIRTAKA